MTARWAQELHQLIQGERAAVLRPHHRMTGTQRGLRKMEVQDHPHLVSSLLKRWTAGTLHHRISRQHLPYYLDEFTFRFNRRTSRARGLLFYRR